MSLLPQAVPKPVTIRTLEEWEACKAQHAREPLLLQMGSPTCVKCPAFTERIEALRSKHKFTHVYANTHDCEEDLLAELEVTKLPAYLLLSPDAPPLANQAASPDQITAAVTTACPPDLQLDEEF